MSRTFFGETRAVLDGTDIPPAPGQRSARQTYRHEHAPKYNICAKFECKKIIFRKAITQKPKCA